MVVLCWPWKGAQADLALRAYVASDAITPCKGRWKTCLPSAGGSHPSPPTHGAGHGRLGPAALPAPSARDAHCGGEDGAGDPRPTSPSSGNAAAPFPALLISRSISWGAESQLTAHSQPLPQQGFSLQSSRSCHDPCGLAAVRESSLRDSSGQRGREAGGDAPSLHQGARGPGRPRSRPGALAPRQLGKRAGEARRRARCFVSPWERNADVPIAFLFFLSFSTFYYYY